MSVERAKQGLCALCDNPVEHGPWTSEQIAEVTMDTGAPSDEFQDWCDDCFVECVATGDAAYAERLVGRPMKLRKPENAFRVLLGLR